ncbi:hypothetical protein J6590_023022 [Homalodisca vitripennis]|nr:hypothetical protein J6590_023022 [Homalodisca vitripennis]
MESSNVSFSLIFIVPQNTSLNVDYCGKGDVNVNIRYSGGGRRPTEMGSGSTVRSGRWEWDEDVRVARVKLSLVRLRHRH